MTKHVLYTPSKVLSLGLLWHPNGDLISADTFIANRTVKSRWRRKLVSRIPGSTTRLFSEARTIMQVAADESDLPVLNSFFTSDRRMRAWALAPEGGKGIFNWIPAVDNGPGQAFNAVSTIYPSAKEIGK
jgi:hypothetical protein